MMHKNPFCYNEMSPKRKFQNSKINFFFFGGKKRCWLKKTYASKFCCKVVLSFSSRIIFFLTQEASVQFVAFLLGVHMDLHRNRLDLASLKQHSFKMATLAAAAHIHQLAKC